MKVIYIMGAGHIGSTIVEIVLSSNPQIESVGETSKLHHSGWLGNTNRRCACGSVVNECIFWPQVRQKWAELTGGDDVARYVYLQKRFERMRTGWLRLFWNSRWPSQEFKEYLKKTEALYQAISEKSGKNFIVESSLSPKRAYVLSKIPGIDLYLIYMVRDGRGCIWSLKKPAKQTLTKPFKPAPSWRTTKYWISANLQSRRVYNSLQAEKRLLIRYEDFVIQPSLILEKIGHLIGEDLSNLLIGSDVKNNIQSRHTVGGNRVRMQKNITIKADFAWMENLPAKDRAIFWLMAGWLAKRYGYMQRPAY